MSSLLIIPILYIAAVLDTCLAARWQVHGIAPDLVALVAFIYLYSSRGRYAFLIGALAGFASDLNSTSPLGLGMAAFALVAYGVVLLRQNLHLDGAIARLIIVGVGVTATCLLQSATLRCIGRIALPWQSLVEHAVLVGIYTAAVAIPLLMVYWWFGSQRSAKPLVDQPAAT
jgi:rod shape-determining protein MreD